jgi:hypothetical protein
MILSYSINDVIILCNKIPVISFAEDRKIEIEAEAEFYSYKQDAAGDYNFIVQNNNKNYNIKIPLLKGSPSNIFFTERMMGKTFFDIILLQANLKLEFASFFYSKACTIIKAPVVLYSREVPTIEWEIKAFNGEFVVGK